jgi:hypothetical protein
MTIRSASAAAGVATAVLLTSSPVLWAHVPLTQNTASVTTITLDIETVAGGRATAKARDGGRITVTLADGQALALTPTLRGEELEVRLTDLSVAGTETT